MNAVALGQLVANDHDCTAPRYTGNTSAITQVALVNSLLPPGRRGRDEAVRRVARGDGREPRAHAHVLVQQRGGVQPGLLGRSQDRGQGQDGQQPGLGPSLPPHGAEDDAGRGQDDHQARPVPGVREHGQEGVRVRHRGQDGPPEAAEVAAPADQQTRGQAGDERDQQDGHAPERDPAARRRERGQHRQHQHEHVEQDRGVGRGVGQGQGHARRDHAARQVTAVPGAEHAPGREGHEEQGQRVVGGERAQVKGGAQHGEQRGGEERRAPAEPPPGRAPQQGGRPEHEHQRQDPGPGQAARPVRERAERRVDDGRTGEVVRERRDRRAVQPVRPLQVPGPQIQALVLERRVGPDQPERQQRLDDEHRQQRPATGQPPSGGPVRAVRSGAPGDERARPGLRWRRRVSIHHESPRPVPGVPGQTPTRPPGTPASPLSGLGAWRRCLAYRETRGKPGLPGLTPIRRTRRAARSPFRGKRWIPRGARRAGHFRCARPQTVDEQVKQPARPGPPVALGIDPPQESQGTVSPGHRPRAAAASGIRSPPA